MAEDFTLGAEFPPATREDWLKLVRAALKDRPYESLVARTYDGIAIEPLRGRAMDSRPVAGRAAGAPWQVMARVDHPDPAAANVEALYELENGATGLKLVFAGAVGAYDFGLPSDADSVARVLEGVQLDAVAIELETAETSKDAADHVAALARKRGHAPGKLDVRFGHDPIGAHAAIGASPLPWRELSPRFAGHVAELAKAKFRSAPCVADGRLIHNAGGSEALELAYVIAVAVAYLRALESAGVALDDARRTIHFRLASDAEQFLTIAKLRALRKLWTRVEEACGLEPRPAFVAAETAWRMMTRRDPWVNMLRTTIAAFAAGVGGANAITVLPFTTALGLPDRFARRIARNTQLLLLEESNLARVADPAAGSGAVEDLTGQLCRTAWALFQEIEAAGGAAEALAAGLIQKKVAQVRAEREKAVATRADALMGTSDYPDLAETPVKVLTTAQMSTPLPTPPPQGGREQVIFQPLPRVRLAEPYERLRDASDRMLAETGSRPKVLLANLGTVGDYDAPATFAKNFFEAGGIETVAGDGDATTAKLVAAYKDSGAQFACLCSSDEVYVREAAEAARALAAAGAKHIYLAGRPGKLERALNQAGVGTFLFAGCDALRVLERAHQIVNS